MFGLLASISYNFNDLINVVLGLVPLIIIIGIVARITDYKIGG